MSKKEKDLSYYKKYVIIDLWVLIILALLVFLFPIISGIAMDASMGTGMAFTALLSSIGLVSILLMLGEVILFIVCLVLTKKEHPISGILNIVLAALYILNFNLISILAGVIHLVNSIGYQKHLKS